jgi:peroxiredoxin
MAQAVSVTCPSCEAVLKVTKSSLMGKRVACPSCKQPVRIPSPADAMEKTSAAKAKNAESPLLPPLSNGDDLDSVLLSDDDPPPKSGAKSAAPSSGSIPNAKPRSSTVWKKMGQTETSEFEAMLVDTDDEIDESSFEAPLTDRPSSSGSIRKRGRKGKDSHEFDEMLSDTNAEQDALTDEAPAARSSRKKCKSSSKRSRQSEADDLESSDDDFGLEEEGLAENAALPPRRPISSGSSASDFFTKNKTALIVAVVVVCSLLMAFMLYSVTRVKAPPPMSAETQAQSTTAAGGARGKSTPTDDEEKDSPAPATNDAKNSDAKSATPAADGNQSGHDDGQKHTASSPGDTDRPNSDPKTTATATGAGVAATSKAEESVAAAAGVGPILGRKIPEFSATAIDNTTYRSAGAKQKVMVVAFFGVECPLANLYYPRLVELATKYSGKSVAFVAINSNSQDTLDAVHKQARVNKATFPVLKDAGTSIAQLFGAERTPEVFVLDHERAVRYHGMIDDQYGYRQRRSQPTKEYVIDAVDALLEAKTVSVAETPVQGCHIGRIQQVAEGAHSSFYRDVLPVLQNRCQQCHRKGEIGPFALKDFAEVRDWGPTIREAVAERRMPPWPADSHFGKFSNDMSLSDTEIATITKWVDEGCPEGNSAEKPPERKFVDGWNIGKPDRVFTMEQPFHVPATGVVGYQEIYASPVFMQDMWVQAVECRFGNRSVVHHMLVLLDFPHDRSKSQDGLQRGFFAAGAPGSTYFTFPKGYAKKIPKGARLRFQMHYTPNGTATEDLSKFGIIIAKEKQREVQTYALGKLDINIPAGDADHVERAVQAVNGDVILTTLMPHLHVRGKSFTFTVVRPNGKTETLLSIPRWDFNWQPQYQLVKPVVLTKGSQIIVEAHWDNSADNPNNILPPVDVQFGEQTFDEMFIGYVNFIPKTVADAGKSRGRKGG